MKRMLALLVALIFTLGVVGFSFAADLKGTVSKVDGAKITVKDTAGKETTVEDKDAKVKVGDKVTVKDGKVVKEKKKVEGC